MANETDSFEIDPRSIRNRLLRISAFLVVLGTAVSVSRVAAGGELGVGDLGGRFELHTDYSLPAWFSSLLLGASAPLFALLAHHAHRENDRRTALAWGGLALLMLSLSIDEIAGFHEYAGIVLGIEVAGLHGGYSWVAVGAAFVVVFGLVYAPFVWRLEPALRRGLIVGVAVFFGGAVAFETLNAFTASRAGTDATYRYVLQTAGEEGLEMVGSTLVLYALLAHLQRRAWSASLHFRTEGEGLGAQEGAPPRFDG